MDKKISICNYNTKDYLFEFYLNHLKNMATNTTIRIWKGYFGKKMQIGSWGNLKKGLNESMEG
jgi:hypothetical protein